MTGAQTSITIESVEPSRNDDRADLLVAFAVLTAVNRAGRDAPEMVEPRVSYGSQCLGAPPCTVVRPLSRSAPAQGAVFGPTMS